jgi:hypothetical protein
MVAAAATTMTTVAVAGTKEELEEEEGRGGRGGRNPDHKSGGLQSTHGGAWSVATRSFVVTCCQLGRGQKRMMTTAGMTTKTMKFLLQQQWAQQQRSRRRIKGGKEG